MNHCLIAAAVAATALTLSGATLAQNEPRSDTIAAELEVTMVLMPQGAARPDAITRIIALPPAAVLHDRAEAGEELDADDQRQTGLDTAAEARERGREFGQSMAEQARENREDAGRGNAPVDPPGGPPVDPPGGPPIDPPEKP